jgi:hypothetical protein
VKEEPTSVYVTDEPFPFFSPEFRDMMMMRRSRMRRTTTTTGVNSGGQVPEISAEEYKVTGETLPPEINPKLRRFIS